MSPLSGLKRRVAAALTLARTRRQLRARIDRAARLRVVLGASGVADQGWIATDVDTLDIVAAADWSCLFRRASIDALLAEHVFEHLEVAAGRRAAANCFAFLKPGGYLRVAVPDGLHPDPAYRDAVRPGGSGAGAADHRVLYDHLSFAAVFAACGFRIELLEYWDGEGRFVCRDWDPADGLIRRSRRFDARNAAGELRYTSIVLDAVKDATG